MREKTTVIILGIAAIVLAAVLAVILFSRPSEKVVYAAFTAPGFDSNALKGIPDTSEESYTRLSQDGLPYSVHICGELFVYDEYNADLYFTNDGENDVWLKLRAYDESDELLAETGLIRPGEYIKSIKLSKVLHPGDKVRLKIMSYEPNTYYSLGCISLNAFIKGR